ncbi:MAG: hypothetical protein RSA66_02135 [Muribaculaceae bacterium]
MMNNEISKSPKLSIDKRLVLNSYSDICNHKSNWYMKIFRNIIAREMQTIEYDKGYDFHHINEIPNEVIGMSLFEEGLVHNISEIEFELSSMPTVEKSIIKLYIKGYSINEISIFISRKHLMVISDVKTFLSKF